MFLFFPWLSNWPDNAVPYTPVEYSVLFLFAITLTVRPNPRMLIECEKKKEK